MAKAYKVAFSLLSGMYLGRRYLSPAVSAIFPVATAGFIFHQELQEIPRFFRKIAKGCIKEFYPEEEVNTIEEDVEKNDDASRDISEHKLTDCFEEDHTDVLASNTGRGIGENVIADHPGICLAHAWALMLRGAELETIESRLEIIHMHPMRDHLPHV